MLNLGLISYSSTALAYGLFSLLLLSNWKGSLQGKLFLFSMAISFIWATVSIMISLDDPAFQSAYQISEVLRYTFWHLFLIKLFEIASSKEGDHFSDLSRFTSSILPKSLILVALLLINTIATYFFVYPWQYIVGTLGVLLLSIIGLLLLEQLYRNTSSRHRWSTKYLLIGLGVVFIYDFYMYSDALMFGDIDMVLWEARGFVHTAAVPLIAVAASRQKDWANNIFVSRDIVVGSTAVIGSGLYLLTMSGVGFYIRQIGGTWGELAQITFIMFSLVILVAVFFSVKLRSQARVFIVKHFYKNKYDYRAEWLSLTEALDVSEHQSNRKRIALKALAGTVDARAGQIWLRDTENCYVNEESWYTEDVSEAIAADSSIIQYFLSKKYIVNIDELISQGDEYNGLLVPDCISRIESAWLIIPLYQANDLLGFVLLADPLFRREINWEDRDLLKAAARQVSNYLTVIMTSAKLAEVKQFEVFTRLSAFMVHDLKNITAELELVAQNAKKHADNPEFIKDAFETVEDSSRDIKRILQQLRDRHVQKEKKVGVKLVDLVMEIVALKEARLPVPVVNITSACTSAPLEKSRLANVISNIIDNAQQATDADGDVVITLTAIDESCVIEISDTGHGMDKKFIRERLFKPFDTTKGNAGMGIGMHESRHFIRELGGDISVDSVPGRGTRITLQLPGGIDVVSRG